MWHAGLLPNVVRNSLVNAAEMVTYDMMKEAILARRLLADDVACHVTAAFASGFFATVVSSPVDVMKTRYVNAESGVYRCAMHCARCMYREGGLAAFYKGSVSAVVFKRSSILKKSKQSRRQYTQLIAPYVEWTYDAPSASISSPSIAQVHSWLLCAQP